MHASGWWLWGGDGGAGRDGKRRGLAEGPVLGRLRGEKQYLGMRKRGRRIWGGIGEKNGLLWDKRSWDAKRDIGWGSWGYCPTI